MATAGRKQQGDESRLRRITILLTESEFNALDKLKTKIVGGASRAIRLSLANRLARDEGADLANELAEVFLPGVTEKKEK
jgi:hypothetical protein